MKARIELGLVDPNQILADAEAIEAEAIEAETEGEEAATA